MTMATTKEVIREHLPKYFIASREKKSEILDHLTAVLGMHRKAVIRALRNEKRRDGMRQKKKPGPSRLYTHDVVAALKDIWEAGNEVCGELLHPVVNEYVDILIRDDMWDHTPAVTSKVRYMSLGTMKRKVGAFFKIRRGRKGISTTKPSALKKLIPIFTGPWEDKPPGYGQIDTVVHCGSSLLGDGLYTVNYTDAATFMVIPYAHGTKAWKQPRRACRRYRSVCRSHGSGHILIQGVSSSTGLLLAGVRRTKLICHVHVRGKRMITCMWRNVMAM